jgi:hypothetical protein
MPDRWQDPNFKWRQMAVVISNDGETARFLREDGVVATMYNQDGDTPQEFLADWPVGKTTEVDLLPPAGGCA